ncbi:MAG: TMEM175 family protein [Microthrixaceae bacterium]|nr:TMEM175 family protein [Microthrixaceae bacterium]
MSTRGRASPALLSANGTQFTSFLISFVVIVAFWRKNHELVARMSGLDASVVVANIVVIGLVVFIPFTTEAMGDPDLDHLALPTALYAANVAVATIASVVMFRLAQRRGLVAGDDPPAVIRAEMLGALAEAGRVPVVDPGDLRRGRTVGHQCRGQGIVVVAVRGGTGVGAPCAAHRRGCTVSGAQWP